MRGHWPGEGMLAFPGGFCDHGEDPEVSVVRELMEETGVVGRDPTLLLAHGAPERDPRKHVVTLLYHVVVDPEAAPEGGDDALDAAWHSIEEMVGSPERLAFDHHAMLVEALARVDALGL